MRRAQRVVCRRARPMCGAVFPAGCCHVLGPRPPQPAYERRALASSGEGVIGPLLQHLEQHNGCLGPDDEGGAHRPPRDLLHQLPHVPALPHVNHQTAHVFGLRCAGRAHRGLQHPLPHRTALAQQVQYCALNHLCQRRAAVAAAPRRPPRAARCQARRCVGHCSRRGRPELSRLRGGGPSRLAPLRRPAGPTPTCRGGPPHCVAARRIQLREWVKLRAGVVVVARCTGEVDPPPEVPAVGTRSAAAAAATTIPAKEVGLQRIVRSPAAAAVPKGVESPVSAAAASCLPRGPTLPAVAAAE